MHETVILLVEDDPNEIDIALRALERAGVDFSVEIARDGVEALAALGIDPEGAPASDGLRVVFLDLKMPRLDGWEVLRRIRSNPRTTDLPVVVFSTSDRIEHVRRSFELGANSFVVKRFDPRGPGTYFVDAARYWVELNHSPRNGDDQ